MFQKLSASRVLKALMAGKKRASLTSLAVLVIITSIFTIFWSKNSAAWNAGTTRQPERYTELYFVNPRNLPKDLTAKKVSTFSYRTTNHEGQNMTYHATVTIVENGRARMLEQDTFSLRNEATQDTIINFTTDKPGTNVELIVDLPDQAESIHFRSKS